LTNGQRHQITRGSRDAINVRVTRHARGQTPVWLVRLDAWPTAGTHDAASHDAPPDGAPHGAPSSGAAASAKRTLIGKIRGKHAIPLIVDPLARNWIHLWQLALASTTIDPVPTFEFDVTLLAPRQLPQVSLRVVSHGTFRREVVDFADPDAWDTTMFSLAREVLGALDPAVPPALSVMADKGTFTRHRR